MKQPKKINETINQLEVLREKLPPDDPKVLKIDLVINNINAALDVNII